MGTCTARSTASRPSGWVSDRPTGKVYVANRPAGRRVLIEAPALRTAAGLPSTTASLAGATCSPATRRRRTLTMSAVGRSQETRESRHLSEYQPAPGLARCFTRALSEILLRAGNPGSPGGPAATSGHGCTAYWGSPWSAPHSSGWSAASPPLLCPRTRCSKVRAQHLLPTSSVYDVVAHHCGILPAGVDERAGSASTRCCAPAGVTVRPVAPASTPRRAVRPRPVPGRDLPWDRTRTHTFVSRLGPTPRPIGRATTPRQRVAQLHGRQQRRHWQRGGRALDGFSDGSDALGTRRTRRRLTDGPVPHLVRQPAWCTSRREAPADPEEIDARFPEAQPPGPVASTPVSASSWWTPPSTARSPTARRASTGSVTGRRGHRPADAVRPADARVQPSAPRRWPRRPTSTSTAWSTTWTRWRRSRVWSPATAGSGWRDRGMVVHPADLEMPEDMVVADALHQSARPALLEDLGHRPTSPPACRTRPWGRSVTAEDRRTRQFFIPGGRLLPSTGRCRHRRPRRCSSSR